MERSWTPAQEAAMSIKDKLLLVSAAAGSGKTAVLTERIIRSLTQPENPADLSRILVVTYTRAAAAELKSKIGVALSVALAKNPKNAHLSRQLFLLGSANISTIDSFFAQTLRAHFDEAKISTGFRIADDSELSSLSLEILDRVIKNCYEKYKSTSPAGSGVFSTITSNRFATDCMDHLLKNRQDKELDQKLLDFYDSFASFPKGIEKLKESATVLRALTPDRFLSSAYGKALGEYMTYAFEEFRSALLSAKEYLETDETAAGYFSGALANDLDFCQIVLDGLKSERWESLCGIFLNYQQGRFPSMKNKPEEMENYKEIRNEMKEFCNTLCENYFSQDRTKLQAQFTQTADLAEFLYELYSNFQTELMAEKLRRGILEFNDIRAKVYELLTLPDGSPSPIAEEISKSFDAVYIDEYQDVDYMQDRIFDVIGKNRRFMVGDIKQSIYGFRGSEPSIFSSYRNAMPLSTEPDAATSDKVCVFMSNNFRCDRSIINYANRICSLLFSACQKSIGYRKEDDLICSKAPKEQGNYPVHTVVFEGYAKNFEGEKEVREARWVASEIARMLRLEKRPDGSALHPSDIAILVRNISHAEPLLPLLSEYGVPVSGGEIQNVFEAPLTVKLINLFTVIDNPYRDLPLSEVLLSQNFGFTPEEVFSIRHRAGESLSLFDALSAYPTLSDTDALLCKKISSFLSWLEGYRNLSTSLPADRFIRLLYLDPAISAEAGLPEALFLYEEARSYQRSSWCGLYGFLEDLKKKSAGKSVSNGLSKAEDAVRIMTIHKSKGLEFPVVFLFGTGKNMRNNSVSTPLSFHRNLGFASSLFSPEFGTNRNTVLRNATLLEECLEDTEENIRVLYVALTRAKERLIVTGSLMGSYDAALKKLRMIQKDARFGILSASSYLQWILAGLSPEERNLFCFPITEEILMPEQIFALVTEDCTPIESNTPAPIPTSDFPAESIAQKKDLQENDDVFKGIPTKVAASKISPNLVDRLLEELSKSPNADNEFELQLSMMEKAQKSFDTLLMERIQPTPTEIGTATHNFLQTCDFANLAKFGLQAELDRLAFHRFLTSREISILNQKQIEKFLKSDLFAMIRSAKKVIREQQFGKLLELSNLTENPEIAKRFSGEKIFVQGSMDLILEKEDGSVCLVDYKTDRVTEEEKADEALLIADFSKRHSNQLSCYALAFEDLFGKQPDEVYLYSLPMGKLLPIEIHPNLFLKNKKED